MPVAQTGLNPPPDHAGNERSREDAAPGGDDPEVVIVDVTPGAVTGISVARGLSGLPAPPLVILTSSADPAQFGAELNSYRFIAKADITATVITDLANTREEGC